MTGCKNKAASEANSNTADIKNIFGIEDFENAMKDKGYDFEILDVDEDFLPTTRKRLVNNDMAIDIYIFDSEEDAQREAGYIDDGGCTYNNGRKGVHVTWVSYPHFFKKGCLIVQYVGEDIDIVKDLGDIMGEQFAGYRWD